MRRSNTVGATTDSHNQGSTSLVSHILDEKRREGKGREEKRREGMRRVEKRS